MKECPSCGEQIESPGPDPEFLLAFQHVLQALKVTADVLATTLSAMEHGERLSDAVISDYRSQLANVEHERWLMEELIRALRSMPDVQ